MECGAASATIADVRVHPTREHHHSSARRLRELAGQLVRFGVVGASNTAITLCAFAVLIALGVPSAAAGALSFALGAANGYHLNRGWTFASDRRGAATAARYVAVQGFGAGLDAVGIAVASDVDPLPRFEIEALVLPVVTLLTFALSRGWVFGSRAA
jgi:putative flippase GtrA